MAISRHDAAQALSEIEAARARTQSMQRYRRAAPYCVLWGIIWMIANTLVYAAPLYAGKIWGCLSVLGALITLWLSVRSARSSAHSGTESSSRNRVITKTLAAWLLIIAYFTATFALLPHLSGRQINAFISLFWAFTYATLGLYLGWRLLVIGIVTVVSILVGYFFITAFFFLWMGLVSGSLLVLGGLWLRKV